MKMRLFAFLSLVASLAAADTFCFVQISDTHHGPALHQWRFRQAIGEINAMTGLVECVVHTGDFACNGFSDKTASEVTNLLALIRPPLLCVAGNHDLPLRKYDREKRFRGYAAAFERALGPLGQAYETSNALYVAVCTETLRQDGVPEIPGFDALRWLDERLGRSPGKPAFVFTHAPDCDDFYDGAFHPGWTSATNRAAFRAVLARHPDVKAVIGGHFHRTAFEQNPDGIPTLAGPAFAKFWGRQGAYRIFRYDDTTGTLSFGDQCIEDPPPETHINRAGFIVPTFVPTNAAPTAVSAKPEADAA